MILPTEPNHPAHSGPPRVDNPGAEEMRPPGTTSNGSSRRWPTSVTTTCRLSTSGACRNATHATRRSIRRCRPPLAAALRQRGIEQLYAHQAAAIDAGAAGRDVVVVTGTASGKTLCYNLPVLETLCRTRGRTALYLFPTKALAQDQLQGAQRWPSLSRRCGEPARRASTTATRRSRARASSGTGRASS